MITLASWVKGISIQPSSQQLFLLLYLFSVDSIAVAFLLNVLLAPMALKLLYVLHFFIGPFIGFIGFIIIRADICYRLSRS